MLIEYICISIIFITLSIITVLDLKYAIIPDKFNLILLINGFALGLVRGYRPIDYFVYLFLVSVPLLFISYLSDFIMGLTEKKSIAIDDLIIFIFSIAAIIPFFYFANIKIAFVLGCTIFLLPFIYSLIVYLIIKRTQNIAEEVEDNEEEYSLGGGDIKLFATLGLNFGFAIIPVAFFTFLSSLLFGLVFRKKRIKLGPFILFSTVLIFVIGILC